MLEVFKEHRRWNQILGVGTVGDFNVACNEGYATDLINVSEALQEKRFPILPMGYTTEENGQRVNWFLSPVHPLLVKRLSANGSVFS